MSKRSKLVAWVVALVAALAVIVGGIGFAFAADDSAPDHEKSLTDNGDGTYQLELSVTGEADTTTSVSSVNVIVVYDASNSMGTRANGTSGRNASGPTRADAAEKVVYDFTQDLFAYQNEDDESTEADESENIEMALVTFNGSASTVVDWTSTETDVTGKLSSDGTYNSAKLDYDTGTNWEAGLDEALALLSTADDSDPTFVIFITDGAPTVHVGGSTTPSTDYETQYEYAMDEARDVYTEATATGGSFYTIYAYGTEADWLATLTYYAYNGSEPTTGRGTTFSTAGYYNASNTTALESAISAIFEEIAATAGVTAVSIADGTTSNVSTTSGDIADLLEVDEDSFQYWLSIPVTSTTTSGTYTFTRVDPDTGASTIYTVVDNGKGSCTVTWTDGEDTEQVLTVSGSVKNNNFKFEWTEATELSNGYAPPVAEYNDETGAVEWDLSSCGVLLNDVTYSVTFDVWPSQYCYDLIAQIQNGDVDYDDLDANVQKYLTESGGLYTNTEATLTYSDTRDGTENAESAYNKLSPVSLVSQTMSVSKEWENLLDAREVEEIDMTVLADEEDFTDVTLTADSNPAWTEDPIYISPGLMRTKSDGTMQILNTGHDFTFAELGAESYNWELVTPVIHPMLIDGELVYLVLVDDNFPNDELPIVAVEGLEETYEIDGSTYYVAGTGEASLTAYNYRRSNLNLTKVVDGEDADPDQTFPFKLTVTDSNSDDVWFSIYDTNAGATVTDATVTGATAETDEDTGEKTGYYYATSGSTITVQMKAGWNLRFINLPTGSTYTFVEDELATGYAFDSSGLVATTYDAEGSATTTEGTAADSTFSGAQTTTGTIQATNTSYQVTYTNVYELTDLEITKVWDDNDDQDGIRPSATDFAGYLNLLADGTDVTDDYADYLTVTDKEDGTYTIAYTSLPRFVDGDEVTYTVTEDAITGYTTTYSNTDPADATDAAYDYGTITNTHTPETIDISATKVWEDNDNQDGIRPESVVVTLTGTVGETTVYEANSITLDGTVDENGEATAWVATWEDVDKYYGGTEIDYTVVEVEDDVITGTDGVGTYAYEVTENEDGTFTVTNTHTPETTGTSVEKVWDDADNQDGCRPESVTVNLLADGVVSQTATLSEDNSWKESWTGLPKYRDGGTEIDYTVVEVEDDVITGTDGAGTYAYAVTENEDGSFTVTNTHTPETVTVSGKKEWKDEKYQDLEVETDYERPEVTITLTGLDGKTYEVKLDGTADEEPTGTDAVGYESAAWEYTFVSLPKYADGDEIEYSVSEGDLDGFAGVVGEDGTTVINTPEETKTVKGTSITILKTDENTGNGLEGATFTLTDSDGNETTYTTGSDGTVTITFEGYETDEDVEVAKTSTYRLEETVAPTGYEANDTEYTVTVEEELVSVTLNTDSVWEWLYNLIAGVSADFDEETNTLTVTNPPTETTVTVTKVWEDNDDQDVVRPESVSVQLYADGTAYGSAVTLDESNEWAHTWSELAGYADGELVEYTVTEATVEDYTTEISEISGDVENGYSYTVTNSYTPEQTGYTVEKVWEDMDDINGMRPDSVTVKLLADGEETGKTAELNEDNSWKDGWTGLPKYKDGGTEIVYTAAEDPVPTGYTASYIHSAEEGKTTVTNTLDLTDDVSVKKAWNTNGDTTPPDGATVTFTLYADGTATKYSVELDGTADGDAPTVTAGYESEAWAATFVKLPKTNADGEEIAYTVVETGTYDGYTCSGSPASDGGTITNTHTDDEKEVTYGDTTTVIDGHVASAGDVLTYTITYNNNTNETATVTVTDTIPEYTTYNEDASPEATFADGVLTWTIEDVAAGASGEVTFSVTVDDDANGQKIENDATVQVGENTSTTNQVTTNIPVKEVSDSSGADIDGEGVQVGDTLTYEVTFTIDEAVTEAVVKDTVPAGTEYLENSATAPSDAWTVDDSSDTITWAFAGDEENMLAAGTYTVSFQVVVTEDALELASKTIENTAYITVNDDPEVNTNTVTNTPESGALSITKTVENEALAEGETDATEFTFTVTLKDKNGTELTGSYALSGDATGTIASGGTVTLADGQTATITGLPAGATYEVVETAVANYTTTSEGASGTIEKDATQEAAFTNTYEVTTVAADKVWSTNGDDTPPDGATVTFTLYANGVATGYSVELDGTAGDAPDGDGAYESEAWVATFVNVPVSDADGEIAYTIVETGTYTGYTCSGSPAVNGGTITNTHTDSVKDVVNATDTEISIDGELVSAGDVLTYTITYANNTSSEATVTVTDAIPANTTYVDGSASGGGTYADGSITWVIEGVAAGATGTVSFQVTVDDASNGETIENEATVLDGENTSSTNAVTTSVPVKDVTDESGESIDGEGVQVGDTLTYDVTFTITEDADSVVVTDAVPEHTTLVDDSITQGGTYDESTGVITWDLGALEAGTYTVSFDVTVDESAVTVDGITNTAYISVNNHSEVETNEVEVEPEKGDLTITKTVTVPDGFELDADKAFEFTITLTDKNGTALAESYTYTGSYEGTVSGSGSFSLKHGESITIADLPAGAKYTITETAEDGYTVTATYDEGTIVSDDTVTAEFVNAYSADPVSITFPVQKVVSVPDGVTEPDWSFTINVTANDGAPEATSMSATVSKGADTATFGDFTFTKPGTYTYTVTESGSVSGITNDAEATTGKTITVTVVDNGDGTMTASADSTDEDPVNFVNPYEPEVGLEVTKTVTSSPANGKYYVLGETVSYEIVVTNTGEVDLTDVAVVDEMTGDNWTIATLAGGASETFTTSHKVTKADVDAGSVLNEVTATADNPLDPDNPLEDSDDVTVKTGKKTVVPQTGDPASGLGVLYASLAGSASLLTGVSLRRRKRK